MSSLKRQMNLTFPGDKWSLGAKSSYWKNWNYIKLFPHISIHVTVEYLSTLICQKK